MNGPRMKKIRTAGVIATYNHEDFVQESVLSLAHQVDELVVVDDFSSDKTQDVLRSLKIPNLKLVLHKENMGVSSSYNEAIALSDAEVIVLQGGDDRSLPGRVEQQLCHLSKPGTVLSFGRPVVINSKGDLLPNEAAPEFLHEFKISKVLEYLYFVGNFVCAPSVAVRKSDFENLGGFHPAILHLQDYELWLKFAAFGSFVLSDKPLVEYRKHSNNLSRNTASKSLYKSARFDAEMDYVLGSSVRTFSRSALLSFADHIGLSGRVLEHIDDKLLLALVQLSHPNVTQVRRGLSLLIDVIGEKGSTEGLFEFGIDSAKIDEYARKCDHHNSSANARIDVLLRNINN